MLPTSLDEEFFGMRRSSALPFCNADAVEVIDGDYRGKRGEVVALDRAGAVPRFLVEFGDGTDELLAASSLRLVRGAA